MALKRTAVKLKASDFVGLPNQLGLPSVKESTVGDAHTVVGQLPSSLKYALSTVTALQLRRKFTSVKFFSCVLTSYDTNAFPNIKSLPEKLTLQLLGIQVNLIK